MKSFLFLNSLLLSAVFAVAEVPVRSFPLRLLPNDASAPSLIIHPATQVITLENVPVTLELEVRNPGPLPYFFSVTPEVPNAVMDGSTGVYRFLPSYIQSGTYALTFSADSGFVILSQAATVIVRENNRPPTVQVSFPDQLVVNEGESVHFSFLGIDPDQDDTMVYNIDPLLPNMTINHQTGEVYFAPDYTQDAVYSVNLLVSDGDETVSARRFIVVVNVNRPPQLVLNPPQGRIVQVGETFNLLAYASDPDKDPVTLSAEGLPPNSAFDPTTGRFSFTPTLNQFREKYNIRFSAFDGIDRSGASVDLEVGARVSPLFEFDTPGNTEGWIANGQVQGDGVADGVYSGVDTGPDPFVYRPGLAIDTFSQQQLVIRLQLNSPSPVELFFITSDGLSIGPATIAVATPNVFVTYGVNYATLFPSPKIINTIRIDPGVAPNAFAVDYVGFLQSAFPTRTPTPNPSSTPTPTPSFTPARTPSSSVTPRTTPNPATSPTPTRTPTPAPTPTPANTPTPMPPLVIYDFDEPNAIRDHFQIVTPEGYSPAFIDIADAGNTALFSGNALSILAKPGEGALLISDASVETGARLVLTRVSTSTSSPSASVALVALNAPIDGQLGYHAAVNGAIAVATEKELSLVYQPPSEFLHVGIQVVQPPDATEPVRVLFDNLVIRPLGEVRAATVPLSPDGSFDRDLAGLFVDINQADGSVQVVRKSSNDWGLQLSVLETQQAANIGILAPTLPETLPGFVLAQFEGNRLLGNDGMVALVLTDGLQTLAVFETTANFPVVGSPKIMTLGGNLEKVNSPFPPILVIQNAGWRILTSLLADNLILWSRPSIQP